MDIGGAEMMVQSLCREHRAQGHELSVHCLYGCGVLGEALKDEGIPVVTYGPGRYEQLAGRMYRGFRELRPEVVHCHNVVASVVGAIPGRMAGARTVICTRHGIVARPRNLRRQGLFWLAARSADRVVAVCDRAQSNLARATFAQPGKLVTIWNGAAPAPSMGIGPSKADRREDTLNLITVARLGPPKDHLTLVRALKAASQHAPGLRLFIVGDGPNEPAIRQLAEQLQISHAVQLLGARHDVGDWLSRADLFVLSSLSEGVPISLLEAMAAGLPCVVSDVGGMREIVEMGDAGTVVSPGDVQGLADAIGSYAANRSMLRQQGANARSAYATHFTLQRMAESYMVLYRNPDVPLPARVPFRVAEGEITSGG